MRYLDMDTAKKVSKIGLGTWQFGSREWGYGDSYAGSEAKAIVRRALELGVTLFDTAEIYGFGRSERILGAALGDDLESIFLATKILPVMPVAPVVRAAGRVERQPARRAQARPVPGAPAEPGGQGRHDHARHARAAADRAGRRGRRQQLLAAPLDRRGGRARHQGAEQPGQVQPRRPQTGARPCAVRARRTAGSSSPTARWRRACCPAGTTPTTGRRTGSGPTTRCSCRRTWSGRPT